MPHDLVGQLVDELTTRLQTDAGSRRQLASALFAFGDSTPLTKSEANYRKSDSEERCGGCAHYSAKRCDIVSGVINPDYVCDHYTTDSDSLHSGDEQDGDPDVGPSASDPTVNSPSDVDEP